MPLLQIATILLSRGDVYMLGEAYAFGVVWSFFLKSLGVLVLRYQRHDQEYKHPINLHIGGMEIPLGPDRAPRPVLVLVAIANLFSKQIATIYGVSFTVAFFIRLHHFRAHQRAEKVAVEAAASKNSTSTCSPDVTAGRSPRPSGLRAGGCARLQPAWRICRPSGRRPTCGGTISW